MTDAVVVFNAPLPPVSLRSNSRAHWTRKKREADEYSFEVFQAFQLSATATGNLKQEWTRHKVFPWKLAEVHYEWRYCGVEPDHGNLGGNTKYLQDIMAMAPLVAAALGKEYKRYHLGLVDDDKGIHATYEAVKVPHKAQECVVVTVTKRDV